MGKSFDSISKEEHDHVLLFRLNDQKEDDHTLKEKLEKNKEFSIPELLTEMNEYVTPEQKEAIEAIGINSIALRRFLHFAGMNKLKAGWSHIFIAAVDKIFKDETLTKQIQIDQDDLKNFEKGNGIPRGSLLDRIRQTLLRFGGTHYSPMGKKEESTDETIPVVHPILCVSEDHFSSNKVYPDSCKYRPLEPERAFKGAPKVSFYDIARTKTKPMQDKKKYPDKLQEQHGLFLALLGAAGSGKTCLSKRIVKEAIQHDKFVFWISIAMLDESNEWSLKDLLLKFPMQLHLQEEPSNDDIEISFQWIRHNQEKCIWILDGYDQSSFEISPDSDQISDEDVMKPLKPGDLLSLVLSRRVLSDVRLILTSRPHAVINFPPAIQPDMVIYANNLEQSSVKTLLKHYAPENKATDLAEKSLFAPLLSNPLYLRLFTMLNCEVGTEISSYTNTTAKLVNELIERYENSAHFASELEVEKLNSGLGQLAYEAIMDDRILIKEEELEKYDLSPVDVQDFLVSFVRGSSQGKVTSKEYVFQHLIIQEFFAARHGIGKLSGTEHQHFRSKLFPKVLLTEYTKKSSVGEDQLMRLRPLVLGLLNCQLTHQDPEALKKTKRSFNKFLCGYLKELFGKNELEEKEEEEEKGWKEKKEKKEKKEEKEEKGEKGKDINKSVKECQKKIIHDMEQIRDGREEIRMDLEECHFWFGNHFYHFSINQQQRSEFLYFIEHFVTTIAYMRVDVSDWEEEQVDQFFKAIKSLKGKIGRALIVLGVGSAEKNKGRIEKKEKETRIPDVIESLEQVEDELMIQYKGDFGNNQKEFKDLQKAVKEYKTEKIKHTEELEFVLAWEKGRCRLFHVYLRPEKKPQVVGHYRETPTEDSK